MDASASTVPTALPANFPLIRSSPGLNAELHALIALIFRDFLRPWLCSFSENPDFPDEVIRCIAAVAKEVERRCRKADFVSLLARDLPSLLRLHYLDYRRCNAAVGTSLAGHQSTQELFLGLRPHFALSDPSLSSTREQDYLRQLSDSLLLLFLPSEEYTSECTRYLTREILSQRVLKVIVETLSEPDFINEAIVKLLSPNSASFLETVAKEELTHILRNEATKSFKELNTGQAADILNARHGDDTIEKREKEDRTRSLRKPSLGGRHSFTPGVDVLSDLESLLQEAQETELAGSLAQTPRTLAPNALKSKPLEKLSQKTLESELSVFLRTDPSSSPPHSLNFPTPPSHPFRINIFTLIFEPMHFRLRWLLFTLATFISSILASLSVLKPPRVAEEKGGAPFVASNARRRASRAELLGADHSRLDEPLFSLMDEAFGISKNNWWLWTQFEFFILPPFRWLVAGALDWLIADYIHCLLSEKFLIYYCQVLRHALWPDGRRTEAVAARTPAQSKIIYIAAVKAIVETLPRTFKTAVYGISTHLHTQVVQEALEPFQNKVLNKHFIYAAFDLTTARLTPELVDTSEK